MKKAIFILSAFLIIFICITILVYKVSNTPQPIGEASGEIDLSQEPIQESYSGEKFTVTVDGTTFTVEPVATYRGAFLVMSRKNYYASPEDDLAPVDLCVVWGELADPEHLEHISFSIQAGRWCSFSYSGDISLERSYIDSHFANMHVIPATENILKALKSIKKGEKIYLEGFLVNIYRGEKCVWRSSLKRTDTGSGACEIFYVTKVIISDAIYE